MGGSPSKEKRTRAMLGLWLVRGLFHHHDRLVAFRVGLPFAMFMNALLFLINTEILDITLFHVGF